MARKSNTLRLKARLKRQLRDARHQEVRMQHIILSVLAQLGGTLTLTSEALMTVQHQPGLQWNVKPGFTGQDVVLYLTGVGGVAVTPAVPATSAPPASDSGPAIPLPRRTPLPVGTPVTAPTKGWGLLGLLRRKHAE